MYNVVLDGVKKMSEIDRFFELDKKEKCVRFLGDKLEIFIPMRYQNSNFLVVENKVHTLGIFSMRVNDSIEGGLQMPAVIQVDPVDTYVETKDGEQYFVCVLNKGSRIMTTTGVLKNDKIGYFMWTEFLSLGRMPEYITYDNSVSLFDDLKELTGKGTNTDHVLMEIVLAHVFRDPDNLNVFYRHSNMNKKPAQVTLRDVAYGPSSTHSRIIGSYSDDGRNAALLNQSDQNHTLEDFFRA